MTAAVAIMLLKLENTIVVSDAIIFQSQSYEKTGMLKDHSKLISS